MYSKMPTKPKISTFLCLDCLLQIQQEKNEKEKLQKLIKHLNNVPKSDTFARVH